MTIETILDWIKDKIDQAVPVSPHDWLDSAARLNVLMLDLEDELVAAEMEINTAVSKKLESGMAHNAARSLVKGTEAYGHFLKLKAKKERVVEFVRLAKKRTELAHWDQ